MLEQVFKKSLKDNTEPSETFTLKKRTIDPVINIVSWFCNSSIGCDKLKKLEELRVISYSPIRRNSIYFMLTRFYELLPSIKEVLWKHQPSPPMLGLEQYDFISDILPVLKLFDYMPETVSVEKVVTISKLLLVRDFLLSKIGKAEVERKLGVIS